MLTVFIIGSNISDMNYNSEEKRILIGEKLSMVAQRAILDPLFLYILIIYFLLSYKV